MTAGPLIALLAGGRGSRLGGSKPQLMLAGKSLIERVVDRARLWPGTLRLVVRDPVQAEGIDLPLLLDAPGIDGPLAGIAAALRFAAEAGCDPVLSLPCDTPFLPEDLAERLHEALARAPVAVAASGGRVHSVCAIWPVQALDRLGAYVDTGRRSLHGFAEFVGFEPVEWATEPFDPFFNVNDPGDLAAAEARLRQNLL